MSSAHRISILLRRPRSSGKSMSLSGLRLSLGGMKSFYDGFGFRCLRPCRSSIARRARDTGGRMVSQKTPRPNKKARSVAGGACHHNCSTRERTQSTNLASLRQVGGPGTEVHPPFGFSAGCGAKMGAISANIPAISRRTRPINPSSRSSIPAYMHTSLPTPRP